MRTFDRMRRYLAETDRQDRFALGEIATRALTTGLLSQ